MEEKPQEKIRLVALVGPTAVGKSSMAVRLSPVLNAEILTADSAQIYRYLDIGTAKPDQSERQLVPHHLIDLVEPDQQFSVADYQAAAYSAIKKVVAKGKIPLLVGGSGLYVNAVVDQYAFIARGKSTQLRRRLREEAGRKGPEALFQQLEQVDPRAAEKIHPRDQRRIIRALEVYLQDGRPISEQEEITRQQKPAFDLLMFGLTLPRHRLYERAHIRLNSMLDKGFLNEVKQVLAMGFSPECRGLQSLGYRQLVQYLAGGAGWQDTVESIYRDTRHLAKRQLTWFRKDSRICWLEYEKDDELSAIAEIICTRVKENPA